MDAIMRNQENLSNKSLSKRDYDKDPIIIENNAILINFIALIIGVFFIAVAFIFFKFNESVNSSFGSLAGLVAVLTAFFNRKSSKIIIKDKHIKFIDKNLEKEIIINEHLNIYQTTDTRTTSIKKDEDGFYIVMAIAIFWALIVLVTNRTYGLFFIIFFIFMIYTILYLPSLIFQILTNKSVKNLKQLPWYPRSDSNRHRVSSTRFWV